MSAPRVLLAGASGLLGRHVLRALSEAGAQIRVLSRSLRRPLEPRPEEWHTGDLARPASLAGACDGVDVVVSAAGASLSLGRLRERRSYEADLAALVANVALSRGAAVVVDAGGPDILTRREIAELAFRAVGREPRLTRVAPAVLRGAAMLARPLNPHIAALLRFGTAVSLVDAVAPAVGQRRLEETMGQLAGTVPAASGSLR